MHMDPQRSAGAGIRDLSMTLGLRNLPACSAFAVTGAVAVTAAIVFFRRQPRSSSPSSSLRNIASMEDRRPHSVLVLFVKSSQEDEIARSIKAKKETLKLFEEGDAQGGIRVLLQSEIDSIDSPTFRAEPYMDALNTNSFGRLLFWSPRLPSTHDVVSKNFCEFPVGTACITDFQYKGRGSDQNFTICYFFSENLRNVLSHVALHMPPAVTTFFLFAPPTPAQLDSTNQPPNLPYVCLQICSSLHRSCKAKRRSSEGEGMRQTGAIRLFPRCVWRDPLTEC